jgi:hypothetical protein
MKHSTAYIVINSSNNIIIVAAHSESEALSIAAASRHVLKPSTGRIELLDFNIIHKNIMGHDGNMRETHAEDKIKSQLKLGAIGIPTSPYNDWTFKLFDKSNWTKLEIL